MYDNGMENGEAGNNRQGQFGSPDDAPSLSLDEIIEILSHRHRREMLYHLDRTGDEVVDVETALDWIETHMADRTGVRSNRDDLHLSLIHVHIPKLAETGLVEYDDRQREFRYRHPPVIENWLDLTRRFDR